MPFAPGPGIHTESSTLAKTSSELGWTTIYAGLVVAAASPVFAAGVPTAGCYPDCVGSVDPTLAVAGLATLLVGVVLAAIGRRLG